MNTKLVGLAAAEIREEAQVAAGPPDGLRQRRLTLLAIASTLVIVDQLGKVWALNALENKTIDGPFGSQLRLVYNTGSAFSLGSSFGPIFGVLAVVIAVAMFWVVRNVEHPGMILGLGMVQGGAVGNVIDRLFRDGDGFLGGAVIDFLEVGDWWPVFNVADIAIVVGGALVVLFGSRG